MNSYLSRHGVAAAQGLVSAKFPIKGIAHKHPEVLVYSSSTGKIGTPAECNARMAETERLEGSRCEQRDEQERLEVLHRLKI
jgi:hypothetical protein